MKVMGNSIRLQSVVAERVRELTLERSVSEVDQDEALNGAAVSDVVRIARRDHASDDAPAVPFHVYLQRAAKFQGALRNKKAEKPSEPECPVEKARAQSTTGANAPLNWLTPDLFGGEPEPPAVGGDSRVSEEPALHSVELEEGMVSYSAPLVNSEPTSLLADEWLFSPHSS